MLCPPPPPPQVWDVNMEARPLEVYPVHDYLRSRLCSLYENDSIFDRFECGWNGDDTYPLSLSVCVCGGGGEGVCAHIYDCVLEGRECVCVCWRV